MSNLSSQPRYRIVLEKEDFKFSAAHFTLFPDGGAELLHGHNYRVRVELAGSSVDDEGLLVDIERFKKVLRGRCAHLDSRTLLPAASSRVQWRHEGEAIEISCGARHYRFPADDVLLLPLANTSMELFARMLWEELAPALAGSRVEAMAVAVEEAAGQRCWYERAL